MPLDAERVGQGVGIVLVEDVVGRRGVHLVEELEGGGAVAGRIGGDGDQLEVAVAVHAVHRHQLGEFADARSAEGGPDVDHAELVGLIGHEVAETGGVDRLQLGRFLIPFGQGVGGGLPFVGPFDRAAEGARGGHGDRLTCEHRFEGVTGVVGLHLGGVVVVVDPPAEAELALAVEEKHVRRGDGAVGLGGGLRVAVVEEREIEVVVAGAELHVVQRVAEVGVAELVEPHGLGIVRRDGDDGDAAVLVVGGELLDAIFVGLGRGTVVAGEDDCQDVGVGEVSERIGFAVDPGQRKIGGRDADGEGLWFGRGGRDLINEQQATDAADAAAELGAEHGSEPPEDEHNRTTLIVEHRRRDWREAMAGGRGARYNSLKT